MNELSMNSDENLSEELLNSQNIDYFKHKNTNLKFDKTNFSGLVLIADD